MDEDTVALSPGSALNHGETYTMTVATAPTDESGNGATLDGSTPLEGWSVTFTTVTAEDMAGAVYMTSGSRGTTCWTSWAGTTGPR